MLAKIKHMDTKKPTANKAPQQPVDAAPGDISAQAARTNFEMSGMPIVASNRSYVLAIISALTSLGLAWALAILLPLKTVELYGIRPMEGGRLAADGEPIGRWSPDADAIAYFVNQWGKTLFDINSSTIDDTIVASSQMVVGSAVDQLRELRRKDNPYALLRERPGLIRTYEYKSVNFIKDDVALLRFKAITRVVGAEPKIVHYSLTTTFVRIRPTTREQVMRNPAGLFISNFDLTEETLTK